jgi:hypothetical protein
MAYFSESGTGSSSKPRLCKFTDVYELNNNVASRPSDLILGINMIRIPEMYYILAEVMLEKDPKMALEYYNTVRKHRGLEAVEKSLTIEMINDERCKEMVGEGQIYFNLKRQNRSIDAYDGNNTVYKPSDGIYAIPVPDIEKDNRN